MLDSDVAGLFQTETRTLNQTVRRNLERFPEEFMFELRKDEFDFLISQNVTSKNQPRGGRQKLPLVFTTTGVYMLSCILNNDRAIQVGIAALRAFTQPQQTGISQSDLARKFDQLDQKCDQLGERYEQLVSKVSQQFEIIQGSLHTLMSSKASSGSTPRLAFVDPLKAEQVESIQRAVADYFRIKMQDLKGVSRKPEVALPRQIAMYLIRKQTGIGLRGIGTYFGGRDHTTVLHACEKVQARIEKDEGVCKAIEVIQTRFMM